MYDYVNITEVADTSADVFMFEKDSYVHVANTDDMWNVIEKYCLANGSNFFKESSVKKLRGSSF